MAREPKGFSLHESLPPGLCVLYSLAGGILLRFKLFSDFLVNLFDGNVLNVVFWLEVVY